MITETGRLILSCLLAQDNASISSRKLADLCNLSLSTIRNEINWLNEGLVPYGVHIDARQSQGCKLVIDDEEMASQSFQQLKYDLRRKLFNFNSKSYRSDYIMRRLLISSGYISAEKLSEELFFSSSTVLRSISQAQHTIQRYKLEIKLKKNHGLYIEGNEFNKRVYMLTQHKKFMHLDPSKKALEQKFSDYFLTGSGYYDFIKSTLMELLKNYPELEFSFINMPKLVNYLILCKHRHAYTKDITFTEEQLDIIHHEKAYAFSQEAFQALASFMEFAPSEKDICSFAQIVIGCRTLSSVSQISEFRRSKIVPSCRYILNELIAQENLDPSQFTDDIHEQFALCMETVHCRITLEVPFDMEMFYPVHKQSAITADLCSALIKLIEKHSGYIVPESYIRSFNYFFERLFDNLDKTAIQLNILIVSLYGKNYAQNIADYLTRKYRRYIHALDVGEYSSVAALNLNEYDLVLTDLSSSLLVGDNVIPTDFAQISILRSEFENFLSKQVRNNIARLTHNQFYQTKFKNKDDVFEYIAELHKDEISSKEQFIEDLKMRDQRISSTRKNLLAYISTYNAELSESTLQLMVNDKEIDWNNSKAQFFVFYAYNHSSCKDALIINRTLKALLEKTSSELEELLKEKDIIGFLTPKKYS